MSSLISDIPVCLNNQSKVYVFAIGDQANLECVTDAEPKPTYFRYYLSRYISSYQAIKRLKMNSPEIQGKLKILSEAIR